MIRQEQPDLSHFLFPGMLPSRQLAELFSLSDLHIYLTVPFVLSWSLLNAMSCGCTILASDTAPVQEFIQHEHNGLLNPFFDVEGFVQQALPVLKNPSNYRHLGQNARQLIRSQYDINQTFPQLWCLFQQCTGQT